MKPKYMPVDPGYFELFEREMEKNDARVIYFAFASEPELEESRGKIIEVDDKGQEGLFLLFENGDEVRLDRIIVINGIPGPAYDEYDSYALAPLTCQAGYDDCFME
ncbi:MAG: hypothetical protein U2P89_10625 [Proteiniphilum sp.]|uniref:hypothetical protein n=1 Tax=Proteiniphilum sp. TaxID=1926877 RepID=UPI002ABAC524|nr:hypothetical protein [Proteiniphilum sp.]MDY9919310.1 hypothetical protein [Proteiniphilum sp.]